MLKVIYHVDEREKWSLILGNVKNMLTYGKNNQQKFQIEVLANSVAIIDLKSSSEYKDDIELLINQGVLFAACQNALNAQNVGKQDLINKVQVVPAGVVELAIKQSEGYSYIKP